MTMSAVEVAEATARPILEFGRAWMVHPATAERADELGLLSSGRFGFWTNGRAGVLGDVDRHVATAAIGFMAPATVRTHWEARPDSLSAWQAALEWFDAAARWGRQALDSMPQDRVRRLADLARQIVDGADLSIGALFAGSALIPLPGDAAGDATINLNVLRELRGGAHLSASHAAGLGPHATIMSTDDPVRGGVPWAETFGWSAPHPDPDPAGRRRVEAMTTAAVASAFEVLSADERDEFVRLVDEARATIGD